MAITEFRIDFTGQQLNPRFGHLNTTDTLATVSASGYLNPYMLSQGFTILPSDFIFVNAADGHQIYKPVFTGTTVQLTVLP
jgi:hypothetical protein